MKFRYTSEIGNRYGSACALNSPIIFIFLWGKPHKKDLINIYVINTIEINPKFVYISI